jgi:hypothetical protein
MDTRLLPVGDGYKIDYCYDCLPVILSMDRHEGDAPCSLRDWVDCPYNPNPVIKVQSV